MNESLQEDLEDALNNNSIREAIELIKRAREGCAVISVGFEDAIIPKILSRIYNYELSQPRRKTEPVARVQEKKPEFGRIQLARYEEPQKAQGLTNSYLPELNTTQYLNSVVFNFEPTGVPENYNTFIYQTLQQYGYSDETCYFVAQRCTTIEEALALIDTFR